jgi:hypothetical protein
MVYASHVHQVSGDINAYTTVLTTVMKMVVIRYLIIVLSVKSVCMGHNVYKTVIDVNMNNANYATVVQVSKMDMFKKCTMIYQTVLHVLRFAKNAALHIYVLSATQDTPLFNILLEMKL